MRTSQGKFKLIGLQGPLEGFFLSEAQHSLQRFNALLALLVHERGLSLPTNLARPTPNAGTSCRQEGPAWRRAYPCFKTSVPTSVRPSCQP